MVSFSCHSWMFFLVYCIYSVYITIFFATEKYPTYKNLAHNKFNIRRNFYIKVISILNNVTDVLQILCVHCKWNAISSTVRTQNGRTNLMNRIGDRTKSHSIISWMVWKWRKSTYSWCEAINWCDRKWNMTFRFVPTKTMRA